jgi:dihydroneopterin aldolase|tara:strand:+ start:490 stop:888 length:399 start_codon:yes stop_codon:yes gene_type:complete
MKIIKFQQKKNYSYLRKVIIKNLILNIFVGLHNFEKKKKQRVRFNLVINTDENIQPENKNPKSIVNYEKVIKQIVFITNKKHHELLEDLAEDIFLAVFENRIVTKIKIKIEKLDIIKKTESVGIEITKKRNG